MAFDWNKIETEYVTGNMSYRKLCEKYGISYTALTYQAKNKNWVEKRISFRADLVSKSIEKIGEEGVDYKATLYEIAYSMATQLKEAIAGKSILDFAVLGIKPRDITGAIKDIVDILSVKSDRDIEEQIARIEKLKKDVEGDGNNKKEIIVTIAGELDEYSK